LLEEKEAMSLFKILEEHIEASLEALKHVAKLKESCSEPKYS